MAKQLKAGILHLSAKVVSAHLSKNPLEADDLLKLITTVYQTFASLGTEADTVEVSHKPAVPIRQSIFPDYIVCLEDGKKLSTLKRHLKTSFGLTPDEYRAKWGLRADYPMIAPSYSQRRSDLAKAFGLGRSSTRSKEVGAMPTVTKLAARRARGSKG